MASTIKPDFVPPTLDYRTYELREAEVDDLVERITGALIRIEDTTGKYKYTVEGGRIIDSISWNFWEWPQAIGLYGLFNYYLLKTTEFPDSPEGARTLKLIKEWYTARANEPPSLKNINSMSVLLTLASLMEQENKRGGVFTPEEKELYSGWIEEWAEWVMNELPRTEQGGFQHIVFDRENKNQLWDDSLMMTAKYQFLLHPQYLMDQTTGLWYHAFEFDGKSGGNNFGNNLWARGNCWITIAIPIFLDIIQLPPTDPIFRTLRSTLHRQVDALLQLRDEETGLWRTLLVDDSSYVETSATAGFAAGIFIGVRTGLLDRERYLPTAISALKACIAQVQPSGVVVNVSMGTPVGRTAEFYKNISRLTIGYGQSLVIMALGEWLRLEKAKNGKS
ncbi:hypothetical protein IAT38_000132 [Cryptococcus sp. DSM 104549]